MEKLFQKICNSLAIVSLAVFSQTDVIAQETFTINPEFSENFVKSQGLRFLPVFRVNQKEIEVYKLEKAEVLTTDYENVSKDIELVKFGYEQYLSKKEAIKTIITELNTFINSSDSYDKKENYLIVAQNLATKHDIIIEVKDERLSTSFLKDITNDNSTKTRKLLIHKNGKHTSEKDAIACKLYLEKIPYNEPVELYRDYNTYLKLTEQLSRIPKTEIREIKSSTLERKSVMLIDSVATNVQDLSGNFIELGTKYILIYDNYKDIFVKYQLTDKLNGFYNKGDDKLYSIIQNVDTKDMYYLMNDNYLSKLVGAQKTQWLIETVNKLGYKEYKSDDRYDENFYIKSKTSIIKLDTWTYSELKDNPNYISTLDNDQKQIALLVEQTLAHSKNLEKYSNIYYVQRNKMSVSNINAWREATNKALPLFTKISKLQEKYNGNYSFRLINKSKRWEEFVDDIIIARGILGM